MHLFVIFSSNLSSHTLFVMLFWKQAHDWKDYIRISTSDMSSSIIIDLPVNPREFNLVLQ